MELTESLKEQLKGALAGANNPVEITLYTGDEPSTESQEISALLSSINSVIPTVSIKELTTGTSLKRYPAIQISSPGIQSSYIYYGLPGGYEFASLVEAIRTIASGSIDLAPALVEKIKSISKPIDLEIFVTPTCDKCPSMVVAGFRVANINPLIKVEIVEATSFRPYARGKGVMGVPKTIINDGAIDGLDGAVPIETFVDKLISAV